MPPENEVIDDLVHLDDALDDALAETRAEVDEDGDDEMMAGYTQAGGGDGGAKPASTTKDAGGNADPDDLNDEPEKPAAATPPAATPTPTPAPVKIGRWTEDEVAAKFAELEALKKGQSTVAGHIGDLRQKLQAQGSRTITKDDLPEVVEEFGVEYAEALATSLNRLGLGSGAGPSQAEIDQLVEQRSQQHAQVLEQRLEKKRVMRKHPDADEHFFSMAEDGKTRIPGPKAEAFEAWVLSLPQERQKVIATSWDSDVMIGALSEFKTYQQKASAAPAAPAQPASTRASRVERAVAPRGTGTAAAQLTEDDAMNAGYSSVKGAKR